MDRGFIRLWRRIEDHEFWTEPRAYSKAEAWLDILMTVRWKEGETVVLIGMVSVKCGRGQSIKSIGTWAKKFGWSVSKTRRFLDMLKSRQMVTLESVSKTTRLTVCNYSTYNPKRTDGDTRGDVGHEHLVNRSRTDGEHLPTTEEEGKEREDQKERKEGGENAPAPETGWELSKTVEWIQTCHHNFRTVPEMAIQNTIRPYVTDDGLTEDAAAAINRMALAYSGAHMRVPIGVLLNHLGYKDGKEPERVIFAPEDD